MEESARAGGALVLELVGVAGAGKSTLLRELKRRQPLLRADVTVGKPRRLELLIRHTARFLPVFARHSPRGRWLSWDELRSMAYLEGWRRAVDGRRTATTVFDHGPVFRLVFLREFGPPLVGSPVFGDWWAAEQRAWARTLDLIVWLDAPDAVVLPRIGDREQRHVVKHMEPATAVEFLTRYRRGYEKVLAEMSQEGRFHVMRFDTSKIGVQAIADAVLAGASRLGASREDGAERLEPGAPA